MFKNLSAKYYQENKGYKRKLLKDIKIFLKKKKKKSNNMVMNVKKISQKMKKNKLTEYRKKILYNEEECFIDPWQ